MEIKLNKNGWHHKLQKFVFSDPPTFYNFCPYFWLTNFCILASPFVALFKGIMLLFQGIAWFFNASVDGFDKYICEPALTRAAKYMDTDDIMRSWCVNSYSNRYTDGRNWGADDWADFDFWSNSYFKRNPLTYDYKKREDMDKKFQIWKEKTPNWEEKLKAIKEERAKIWREKQDKRDADAKKALEWEEKNAAKIERSKIRKQKAFLAIIKYTKWIAIVIAVAIACYIGYWIGIFAKYCWDHFWWSKFVTVMKWIGAILGIAVVCFGFVYGIVRLAQSSACRSIGLCRLFETRFMRWIGRQISNGCSWLWYNILQPVCYKIADLFKFFWMYIMAVKKDYCPGIVWDDEKTT